MDNNLIENKIMGEISSGRVKLRSKYIFLAEKFGLSSAFAVTVLLAILFCNLVLFYLKSSDNLTYLSFGNSGVFAFLESFPYLLVTMFIIFIFLSGLIVRKADFAYKSPFGYLALILVLTVIVCGIILTYTRVAEKIEEESFGSRSTGFLFKPLLRNALEARRGGVVGRIVEISDGYLTVQTPRESEKIIINENSILPPQPIFEGAFIVALGSRDDGDFIVSKLQIVNPEQMQMINRGVHRRFGQYPIRTNQMGNCGLVTSTIKPVDVICH